MKAEIAEKNGKWEVEIQECDNHYIVFKCPTLQSASDLMVALERVEDVEIP